VPSGEDSSARAIEGCIKGVDEFKDGEGEGDNISGDGDVDGWALCCEECDCDCEGIVISTETLIVCGPEGNTTSLTSALELTLVFDGIVRSGSGDMKVGGGGLTN